MPQRDFAALLALLAQRSSFVSLDGDPEADSKDPDDMSGFAVDIYPDGEIEVWNTYDGDHPLKRGTAVWHGSAQLRTDGLNTDEMDLPLSSSSVWEFEKYLYNGLWDLLEGDNARRQLLRTLRQGPQAFLRTLAEGPQAFLRALNQREEIKPHTMRGLL